MRLHKHLYAIITIITVCISTSLTQRISDCSRAEYNRCINLADPLLKEPHLVFPDNMADIELVCLTWNQFVDCLKSYTDRCFTPQQRKQFNKAVENPIESVHQMCTQRNYQQEYLQHASCIKSTVTQHDHCGDQYSQLVEQVSQGEAISRASLCCSHDRFRRCVMREAMRMCDRGVPDGRAVRFAEQIIDKALSFLQDQCYNYIPNSGDCLTVSYKAGEDQLAMSTSPWFNTQNTYNSQNSQNTYSTFNTHQSRDNNGIPENDPLSTDVTVLDMGNTPEGKLNNVIPGRGSGNSGSNIPGLQAIDTKVTDVSWMPSDDVRDSTAGGRVEGTSGTILGSRTRPSSYGRSSGWDTSSSNPTNPTPPTRPDWATVSSWHVNGNVNNMGTGGSSTNMNPSSPWNNPTTLFTERRTTTETWYPAAGSHVGNEVDEPNQLGLSKPKNSAMPQKVVAVELSLTMVATVLAAYC